MDKKTVIVVAGCPLCSSSSHKCYRCRIKQLEEENRELRQELIKLTFTPPESFDIDYSVRMDIHNFVLRSTEAMDFEYIDKLSHAYFITITFDPAKFGCQQYEKQRKNYILAQLLELRKEDKYTECYGCFEYHDNGIVHSHLIMITAYPKYVYRFLKSKFTDNSKNKVVIQVDKAKYPQAKQYIEKESSDYYYINILPGYSRTIDTSISPDIKQQKKDIIISPLDYGL